MSALYKHKRYFRLRGIDSSLKTFSSTADANTKIGFTSVWNTSSPTKTEALADSDQTLVVTYEFETEADQTAFKSAIDGAYTDSSLPSSLDDIYGLKNLYSKVTATDVVEHFKTEWLHQDGSVGTIASF